MANVSPDRTLVLDGGGLAGLLACAAHPSPDRLTLWRPAPLSEADPAREGLIAEAIRKRAEAYGVGEVLVGETVSPGPLRSTRVLLAACEEALRLGCASVLWPVHHGEDTRTMCAEADRARLLGLLVGVDASGGQARTPALDTPYLDMTLHQIADLAVDSDVPLTPGWWVEADAGGVEEAIRQARIRRGWSSLPAPAPAPAPVPGSAPGRAPVSEAARRSA